VGRPRTGRARMHTVRGAVRITHPAQSAIPRSKQTAGPADEGGVRSERDVPPRHATTPAETALRPWRRAARDGAPACAAHRPGRSPRTVPTSGHRARYRRPDPTGSVPARRASSRHPARAVNRGRPPRGEGSPAGWHKKRW
jgi:hypothetical protein